MSLSPQFEFIVEPYLKGVRVDSFLVRHLRNYSSFRIQRMIRAGVVSIGNNPVLLTERVFAGQAVQIRLIEPPDKLIAPEQQDVRVVYEDPWLLAVDKPPAQTVHPVGTIQSGTLCNAVQHYLDQQTELKGILRPGIVHRLDRMTSGVIVLSKEHLSHRLLSLQFQRGEVQKEYVAILEGELPEESGCIELPIGQVAGKNSILMSAQPDAVKPKKAVTEYRVIDRKPGKTLVLVKPQTGRLHQIRVHFAAIGFPVLGDDFYGAFGEFKLNDPPQSDLIVKRSHQILNSGRHALHALRCRFKHPITSVMTEVESGIPVNMYLAWRV